MTRLLTALCGVVMLAVGLLPETATAQAYQVSAGDVLQIEVLEDPSLNRQALVLPDGRITVPLVGSVQASGLTLDQIRAQLTTELTSNFAAPPTLFVGLAQLNTPEPQSDSDGPMMDIFVMGAVNTPGKFEVRKGANALQAFAAIGGFTRFAAKKRIQIRRTEASGRQVTIRFNYKALEDGAALAQNTILRDGDIILVPQRRLFE